ncbi:DUF11 domain-containing protein [Diaphorobacter sp. HDW4A]|uniref:DUF5979 domain-containing protein n=1 Tax=Diaphorobacter sp. HDW4A TaxID=2714924 RepID=UPI0014090C16|nr:DUF5979 domain-containing protein [Diaphorobacter sp. HDW4A]QIL83219.1 DUF11 domain-containing protein [Diaphorobacter sp. HDW4A]
MRFGRCWVVCERWNASIWRLLLLGVLLLAGNAHAQGSVTVTAPNAAVGGDVITIPVSMSSLTTALGSSTFSITVDTSLMQLSVTCNVAASSPGACAQVSGLTVNGNVINGNINDLAQSQVVVVSVTGQVPTKVDVTDYPNPGTIATVASLTLAGGATSSSHGNTTVTYLPYDIAITSRILSPITTFAFDTDEIVIENTYVNNGPGPAHGAFIRGELYTRDTVNMGYSPWTLVGLQIDCASSNGAQCPAAPIQLGGDTWYGQTGIYQDRVPVMPTGGSVVVTMRFKIAKPSVTQTCGASYQGVIKGIVSVGSRYSAGSMSDYSNEQLSTASVQLPPCPLTDLSVEITQAPPLVLALNTPYAYEIVFRNNGPLDTPAQLNPLFANHIIDPSVQVTSSGWQCISGGSNCPDANNRVANFPAGTEIRMRINVSLAQVSTPRCGPDTWFGRLFVMPDIYPNGVDPGSGLAMVDSDLGNNSTRSEDSNLNLPRPACPTRDLESRIDSMPAAVKFGEPYVVRFTYTNHGADDLVWTGSSQGPAQVQFFFNRNGNTPVRFASANMTCVASNNATCPTLSVPANFQQPFEANWIAPNLGDAFGMSNPFTIPVNGSLTYEFTLLPIGYPPQCPNGAQTRMEITTSIASHDSYLEPANDPHPNDAIASTDKSPVCEDLTVNKQLTVNGTQSNSVDVNAPLSFSLTATAPAVDQGGRDVTSVMIEDVLPAGFVFDPATPGQFACTRVPAGDVVTQCATFGNGITWDAATRSLKINTSVLKAGSAVSYVILGRAAAQAGVWSNTATLTLDDVEFYDQNKGSNTSNVEFTINGREPTVLKSTSDSVISAAGANVRYNIVVSNPANGDAITLGRLTDALPTGFVLVSSSVPVVTGGGSFDSAQLPQAGDTTLNWGAFMLSAGGSISVDFVVRSNPALKCGPDVINNSAAFRYNTASGAASVAYDGAAPGHPRDDVTFPCVPSTTGNLSAAMVISGEPLPSGFAPEAGMFALCTDPASSTQSRYPATGFATMTSALSAQLDALPVDAVCVVQLDPAKPITAAPVGYRWNSTTPVIAPATLTIVSGQTVASTFTWTLERDVADLLVNFTVAGAPGGYSGSVGVYALCDLPAAGTRYPASGVVLINAQANGIVSGVPVGAKCAINLDGAPLPVAASGYRWSSVLPTVSQPGVTLSTGATASIHWAMAVSTDGNGSGETPVPVPVNQWQALAILSLMMLAWTGWRQRTRRGASAAR